VGPQLREVVDLGLECSRIEEVAIRRSIRHPTTLGQSPDRCMAR
jgi:hypothetical protein